MLESQWHMPTSEIFFSVCLEIIRFDVYNHSSVSFKRWNVRGTVLSAIQDGSRQAVQLIPRSNNWICWIVWCQREHIQTKGVSFLSLYPPHSTLSLCVSLSLFLSWALQYNTMKYLKSMQGLIIHHAITYQLSPAFSISWFSRLCFFILCIDSFLHSILVITERL